MGSGLVLLGGLWAAVRVWGSGTELEGTEVELTLVLLWPKCRTGHRLQAWPSPS